MKRAHHGDARRPTIGDLSAERGVSVEAEEDRKLSAVEVAVAVAAHTRNKEEDSKGASLSSKSQGNAEDESSKEGSDGDAKLSSSKKTTRVIESKIPPAQTLEELNATAASIRKSGMSAEEVQREMGIIYSRRKRMRQKIRQDSLEEKKHNLQQENMRLKRENAHLEFALRNAFNEVAAFERRMGAAHAALSPSRGMPGGVAGHHMPMVQPGMTYMPPIYYGGAPMNFYGPHYPGPMYPHMMHPPGSSLHPYSTHPPFRGSPVRRIPPDQVSSSPSEPQALHGINQEALLRHFLGHSVEPGIEEKIANISVSDLQELQQRWRVTSPEAARRLEEYLEQRQA